MSLTLRAVSLNDQPLSRPIMARFEREGTIGRSDHNTLALPDPERHISRQQAQISRNAAGFVITNVGSANPISVRGQALAQGQSMPLAHHDQVRIGGYLLEVLDEGDVDVDATALLPAGSARAVDATPTPLPPRLDGVPPQALSGDPFADLPELPTASRADAAAPAPRLPDDFDPFAPPRPAGAGAGAAPRGEGLFDDLIPGAAPRPIDEAFNLRAGDDPLGDFVAQLGVPTRDTADAAALSRDPLVLFGAAPPAAAGAASRPDDTPELHAVFNPPKAVPVMAPTPTPIPAPVAPPGAAAALARPVADEAGLWDAFCEGAGVRPKLPQGPTAETMRAAGQLLRNAVEGTLELMSVRATTKQELHADVTVIQARNNNPLKFSPDAQSALEQLLQPPMRGFLDGPAAMTDAMQDLVGHAIGTMAGTRAALEGVLGRFAPQALEAKLGARSMLDSVLPMNRRARLWELYLQHFEAIRGEAQEDFDTLFGKAFLAAYEQQLQRLRQARPGSGSAERGSHE
ncbi:type VI secretion system-associated FHA domain protein TagH [Azohydromonas caseinilytica]|uniref:Type VI secretion system-associated FHA domain protein TagH n=1 Tax=Azohydromonas caseinilytica TaxID=2728836 RepID=A0A848FDJ8_9BURK|nr:type VI secretion system-associated FHA domain protein TagH [Azohydromonas caseinilytica]NML18277.1 type VI secretion system-associated FHA domain protein TagH [Azohydromonas caseinilytica]